MYINEVKYYDSFRKNFLANYKTGYFKGLPPTITIKTSGIDMKTTFLIIALLCSAILPALETARDTLSFKKYEYGIDSLVFPLALITYGVVGIESDELKLYNSEIKEEVNEHIDEKLTIDDFTQYLPFTAVYAFNAFGVKGKNTLRDETLILGTAYGLMAVSVLSLKKITGVERPDGSTNNSFPSGHTATAFMGAEFLYQEYKHKSIWYGAIGYAIASGTGAFRMYNDRHWFTDVVAGAGFGILSTKLSYMIYERIEKKKLQTKVTPYYEDKKFGFVIAF